MAAHAHPQHAHPQGHGGNVANGNNGVAQSAMQRSATTSSAAPAQAARLVAPATESRTETRRDAYVSRIAASMITKLNVDIYQDSARYESMYRCVAMHAVTMADCLIAEMNNRDRKRLAKPTANQSASPGGGVVTEGGADLGGMLAN